MSGLAGLGWLIAAAGMVIHLAGMLLGLWPSDYVLTWSAPLVGFVLMFIGALDDE